MEDDNSQVPPSPDEISALKRLAAGIIRDQGNRFIKELLRDKKIQMGTNKDDFERNLTNAIDSGKLRLEDVEGWLDQVEGWGNQHVYLYNLSPALRQALSRINQETVEAAGFGQVWNGDTVLAFPDEPELTSISFTDSVLRIVWQEASPGWTPVPDKNYTVEEGLDTYEYRAFRKVERRAITRFEAHLDERLAALFIADPIQGKEHKTAIAEARRVIGKLMKLSDLDKGQFDISVVSRNLDQKNLPSNTNKTPGVKTQKSRLASGGSYVEFAASSRDKAYWEEPAITAVRKAVRGPQLPAFQGMDGVFIFQPGTGNLARPLRVQLYDRGDRVRLWAQMGVDEVWAILTILNTFQ